MFLIETNWLLEAPDDKEKKVVPASADDTEEPEVEEEEPEEAEDEEEPEETEPVTDEEPTDGEAETEEEPEETEPVTNLYTSSVHEIHKAFLELRDISKSSGELLSKVSNSVASPEVKEEVLSIFKDINGVRERIDTILDNKFDESRVVLLNQLYSKFNEFIKQTISRIDNIKISNS
jgi:uncharacterized protein YerC